MFSNIFHTIFFQPLYNGFVFLISVLPFHDLGLAIVLLTIVVRFIIFPLSHKSTITQKRIKFLEPEIKKIKDKFKDKKEEQTRQIMDLYRKHGISPFSGFFMILVQFPVFIALFIILKDVSNLNPDIIYSFLQIPENINTMFLGIIDLTKSNLLISLLAGLSQFFQIKLAIPEIKKVSSKNKSFKDELQRSMTIQMKYIMPVFIVFIANRFSSGLALYWTVSNIFAIFHEVIVAKKTKGLNIPNKKNNE